MQAGSGIWISRCLLTLHMGAVRKFAVVSLSCWVKCRHSLVCLCIQGALALICKTAGCVCRCWFRAASGRRRSGGRSWRARGLNSPAL
jgi:hypothetical protein